MVTFGEFIVFLQGMSSHGQVGQMSKMRMLREMDRWELSLPGTLSLLQDKVNRARSGRLSAECLLDGGIELCGAVLSEHPIQVSGENRDRLTSGKGGLDEGVHGRNDTTQTSDHGGTGRLALLLHHLLDMAWIVDPRVAVITA